MNDIGGSYSGSYLYNGNLYVHYHARNIGKAMNGSGVSSADMVSAFQESKKRAFQASKVQYNRLFFNSLTQQSKQLLNEVLDGDNGEIMRELQQQLAKKVEEALPTDKITKLLSITKNTPEKLIKDALSNSKTHIDSFNKILQNFYEAAKLLDGKAGANLMLALNDNLTKGKNFTMGTYLLSAMEKFKRENDKSLLSSLQIQQSQQIIQTFNALGSALKTAETQQGKRLTADAAQRMINSIFNTGFAESISAQIKSTAYINLDNAFQSVLTGSKTTEIEYSDEFGNFLARSKGQSSAGKADAMFNNIKVTLNTGQEITLTIGISDKLYKNNNIQSLDKKVTGIYSSGSGGSLIEAIETSFNDITMRYLAVNAIGHGHSQWSSAQEALNEVLLTRQIVRLFSSRGGKQDFAQFMFVNGRIVPIYEIIMSTLEDIHLSSSLGGEQNQPVTLSIQGRGEIQKETHEREKDLSSRISDIAKAFRRAKIKAHVNMNKINFN